VTAGRPGALRMGLAAALALGLVLTPSLAGGLARPRPDAARARIQRLLDARARAFRERDRAAFMATVSTAHPRFRARQARLFRWAAAVPFGSYRLVARWDRYGDLARASDLDRYPGAEAVSLPVTEERFRIGAYDDRPVVGEVFFTFVKEDGRWLVAEDSDLERVGLASARHLWDFGPVATERSAHFIVLKHPCGSNIGCLSSSRDVLPLAERALRRVDLYWRAPWHKRVVIVVPTTLRALAAMLQTTYDLDNFVAFATAAVDVDEGFDYVGERILFNPESIAHRPEDQVLTILSHELTHVATRPHSGPFVPVFVEEGIADYIGHDADAAALQFFDALVAEGGFDGRLPGDIEFQIGSGTDIYTSYQEAHSATRFFVERWGFARLERFYKEVGRPAVAPGTTRYHVDRALRATIGIGLHAFERAWADSIQ
jgi:hypothetical protein